MTRKKRLWQRKAATTFGLCLLAGASSLFFPAGCASTSTRGPVQEPTDCFFGGSVCAAYIDGRTVVAGVEGETAFWLTTVAVDLPRIESGRLLLERKRNEDALLYRDPSHPFASKVADAYAGDVDEFLSKECDALGYSGTLWQRLSAVGGWARTGGRISPDVWIAADPLVGSAGNGPDIVLAGVPFVGGDVAGSMTANIAIAHDVDWSLGRYLGVGPLAPFLFAKRFGGEAPDVYSSDLGLAGLGAVECRPGETDGEGVCAWYRFSPSATGGAYAQLFDAHPDWTVAEASVVTVPGGLRVCHADECIAFPAGLDAGGMRGAKR